MPVQWSIVISVKNGEVQLTPSELFVSAGDTVSWSNQTDDPHEILIPSKIIRLDIPKNPPGEPYEVLPSIEYSCRDSSGRQGTGKITLSKTGPNKQHTIIINQNGELEKRIEEVSAGDRIYWQNLTNFPQMIRMIWNNYEDLVLTAPKCGSSPAYRTPTQLSYECWGALVNTHGPRSPNKPTTGILPIKADTSRPTITNTSSNTCLSPRGGDAITLTGTNLGKATVEVNGVSVDSISTDGGTKLKFTTPAGTAGTRANVIVTTLNGGARTPTSFTYATAAPDPSNDGPYCTGNTIQLKTPHVTCATYEWTGPRDFKSTLQNPTRANATTDDGGTYSVKITVNGCTSAPGTTNVTVNPPPARPTVTPKGETTFCQDGSVELKSSSATGNQWFETGKPINGATTQSITVKTSGSYTVKVTDKGCTSVASSPVVVTVNPLPVVTITADGPTTFCNGGSVTITVFVDGKPTTTRIITASTTINPVHTDLLTRCTSKPVEPMVVTVNPNPNATITAPSTVADNASGCTASVADAGVGATYAWMITNGTITDGTGTADITFKSGAVGTLTLQCTVTTSCGCQGAQSKNVDVVAQAG